jgi:hypothetical protein
LQVELDYAASSNSGKFSLRFLREIGLRRAIEFWPSPPPLSAPLISDQDAALRSPHPTGSCLNETPGFWEQTLAIGLAALFNAEVWCESPPGPPPSLMRNYKHPLDALESLDPEWD